MRNKFYIISLYIFIWIIHKCFCEELSDFVVDLYDSNFTFIEKRIFTYNYTSYEFQNNDKDKISEIENIKTIIICSKEDADKNDDEKNIILFWTTSLFSGTYDITSTYLSAFPLWVKKMKSVSDKTFCFKIQNVGWVANVNDPICIPDAPCPDLIILGTTQFAYRYNRGETLNLEKYLRIYYKKTGKTIENHLDNNWLGIPLIVDFRSMKFNVTTFDYCKNKGYDLHYPPPLSDYWGTNYQETWTWEKAFEYAKIITECTNEPGFKIYANNSYEDTKFFIVLCQALGIPFITDDAELNIKKCGFRNKEHIKKLSLIKELFENHYVNYFFFKQI
ncbi:hypothetical protein BCR32DRAFT_285705 [Anaeromyces robustus]|uniref:Uncharacterized protein n=1 Tax=Anaeromyces robustus TaxID=1754192 RepID=A0A1Y1WGQ6_9FUNG|nr:hypothetical protein BCR32DRAFT_285705 [Anaeromyces robustus]|eukprot:ORX72575.1 hypothetical protein BCR32DRAFT_285705 [Anaeromyces robustus]